MGRGGGRRERGEEQREREGGMGAGGERGREGERERVGGIMMKQEDKEPRSLAIGKQRCHSTWRGVPTAGCSHGGVFPRQGVPMAGCFPLTATAWRP